MRVKIALAAAGLFLTLAQPTLAGQKLGPNQLRQLVPGRYTVTLMGVWNMTVTLHPNGAISGSAAGAKDTGRWGINGAKICIAWNRWLSGENRCSGLVAQAGYYQGSGFTFKRI